MLAPRTLAVATCALLAAVAPRSSATGSSSAKVDVPKAMQPRQLHPTSVRMAHLTNHASGACASLAFLHAILLVQHLQQQLRMFCTRNTSQIRRCPWQCIWVRQRGEEEGRGGRSRPRTLLQQQHPMCGALHHRCCLVGANSKRVFFLV